MYFGKIDSQKKSGGSFSLKFDVQKVITFLGDKNISCNFIFYEISSQKIK